MKNGTCKVKDINETLKKGAEVKDRADKATIKKFNKFDNEIRDKIASDKDISSVVFYGIKEGHFSGGLTGDAEVIIEALVNGMLRDPNLFTIFNLSTKIFVQEQARQEQTKEIKKRCL